MPVLREDMSEIIISIIYFQARKFFSNLRNFNTIFITYNKKTRRQVKSEPFLAWSAMKYTRFKMYKVFLVNLNKSTNPSGQPYTTIYSCVRGGGATLTLNMVPLPYVVRYNLSGMSTNTTYCTDNGIRSY